MSGDRVSARGSTTSGAEAVESFQEIPPENAMALPEDRQSHPQSAKKDNGFSLCGVKMNWIPVYSRHLCSSFFVGQK